MSTPFTEMTVEDIYQWLQTKGFEVDVADALRDAEMDGDAMIGAHEAGLDSLSSIVPSLGKRLKLSRLLKKEMEGISNSANTSCVMAQASSAPKELQKKNLTSAEHEREEGYLSSSSDSVEMQVAESEPEPSSDTDEETKAMVPDVKPPIKHPKVECATGAVALVKRICAKKEQPPLPKPFPIRTNFTQDIAKCLEEKCLTGKARTKFITAIASSIFQIKSYPTRDEYSHVCEQLIQKWPFLRSRTGYGYINEALKERMKYLRGTSGRKRCIQGAEASIESKPKQKKSQHQYPDSPVPPPVPHGEDRASHDRHVRMLAAEYRKLHPNPKITKDIMRRTFPFRRADIKDKVIPLSELLKRYPPLREYTELKMELDRILEKSVGDAAVETWLQLCDKITVVADQETDNQTVKRLRQLAPTDNLSEDAKSLHALCLLYYLMPDTRTKPDHNRIFKFFPEAETPKLAAQQMTVPQPCIIALGTLENVASTYLVVEKQILCQIPPKEIAVALLSAFWAFNMEYTPGCCNIFTFFEVAFLNGKIRGKKTRLSHVLAQLFETQL